MCVKTQASVCVTPHLSLTQQNMPFISGTVTLEQIHWNRYTGTDTLIRAGFLQPFKMLRPHSFKTPASEVLWGKGFWLMMMGAL